MRAQLIFRVNRGETEAGNYCVMWVLVVVVVLYCAEKSGIGLQLELALYNKG